MPKRRLKILHFDSEFFTPSISKQTYKSLKTILSMLESLFGFKAIMKRPYLMFFWTIIISSVAVLLSLQLPTYSLPIGNSVLDLRGFFAIIFTIMPPVYFATKYLKKEEALEEKEIQKKYEKHIFARSHSRDIIVFLLYFFGVVVSFTVWSFFLPDTFFQVQEFELNRVDSSYSVSGFLTREGAFYSYIQNNMNVMFYSFLIGLLFGAGSIFVLTWNASILSTAISLKTSTLIGIPGATAPFLLHGTIEIAGYVLAGLAGSIISAAVIRGHHRKGVFLKVILDTGLVFALAAGLIVLGAGVEAFLR